MTFEPYDWETFVKRVRSNFRFIVCPSIFQEDRNLDDPLDDPYVRFLTTVHGSSRDRTKKIQKGTTFWRAQIGGAQKPGHQLPEFLGGVSNPFLGPHDRERMIPFADKAREGRINPKGIPCLYLATHPQTAMSEVRPSVGSYISLAEFVTETELELVDCTLPPGSIWDDDVPRHLALKNIAWADINDAFSKPVSASDDVADYAPTQIVAEIFRRGGRDGVLYKSGLSKVGVNVALFDLTCAAFSGASLHQATSVEFAFKRQDEDRVYISIDGN
jgi:RES domain-containing protein